MRATPVMMVVCGPDVRLCGTATDAKTANIGCNWFNSVAAREGRR